MWGAERWIRAYPHRLFLDRACTAPFPIDLPDPMTATFHRIVVAHDASGRCREEMGGSGSLMIARDIIGAQHGAPRADGGRPFTIGQIDPAKGFVHVLDDTSLEIVMRTLDTITDFVAYLSKKERFISDGRLGWAAGEDDLLAYYLRSMNRAGEHDFPVPPDIDVVCVDEGLWAKFERHPQRLAQVKADEISYAWDALIETFAGHAFARTHYFTTHPELRDQERILRSLAREPRTRRRMLARLMHELIAQTPDRNTKAVRVVRPSHPGDPYYAFLLLSHPAWATDEEYREVRRNFLYAYCLATKLAYPDAEDIVGIATETGMDASRSEDAIYYDARRWTEDKRDEAERLVADLGLLRETRQFAGVEYEYPDVPMPRPPMSAAGSRVRAKGRDRNAPCPCGSGRKLKRCCGL